MNLVNINDEEGHSFWVNPDHVAAAEVQSLSHGAGGIVWRVVFSTVDGFMRSSQEFNSRQAAVSFLEDVMTPPEPVREAAPVKVELVEDAVD